MATHYLARKYSLQWWLWYVSIVALILGFLQTVCAVFGSQFLASINWESATSGMSTITGLLLGSFAGWLIVKNKGQENGFGANAMFCMQLIGVPIFAFLIGQDAATRGVPLVAVLIVSSPIELVF